MRTLVSMPSPDVNVTWCEGADNWDENDNGDTANGNIMNIDNTPNNGMQRYKSNKITYMSSR